MSEAIVSWYDNRNRRAGYHVCLECDAGKDIDHQDIRIVAEHRMLSSIRICRQCAGLRKRPRTRCKLTRIETS